MTPRPPRARARRVLALAFAPLVALCAAPDEGRAAEIVVNDLLRLSPHGIEGPVVRLGEGATGDGAIVGGFNTGFTRDDDGALVAHGEESELVLPLRAGTAYGATLEVTPARAGVLALFVDGHRVGRARLSGERETVRFEVPARKDASADRFLTFAFHGRARARGRLFRGLRLLKKPTPEPARATFHRITLTPVGEPEAARVLVVHALVPKDGRLVAEIEGAGGASVRVASGESEPADVARAEAGEGRRTLSASLAAHAGEVARFELLATGSVRFASARLLAPEPAVNGAALRKPKNVVVWFIDTLRADKLRCYNPATRVHTPNFDAFARKGALFRRTISQSSHSKPAAATLLTGHYPASHGASTHHEKLRRDVPMLSELFRQAGFDTAGFASNGFIGPRHGFVRGWRRFKNLLLRGQPGKAPYLLRDVTAWLRARKGSEKPFFLYVHSVDPHVPYNPPRQFLSSYWSGRYRGRIIPRRTGYQLDDARAGKFRVGPRDRKYVAALYDGEVTAADHYFGRFLDFLDGEGLADDTLVVVSADHGEELWDHGQPGHGHTLWNELIGVPLIFGPSPMVPSRVVEGAVEMVDVAPTILDLAGLSIPERAQGRSLVPMMRAEPPASPVAFSVHEDRIVAAQQGRFKYVLYRGGAERVFDLDADPGERHDLSKKRPHVRRHLRALAAAFLVRQAHHRKAKDGLIGFDR